MGFAEIAFVLLLAGGCWLAWDSLRTRELANDAMRDACESRGLLFLDDTVALRSLRPMRDDEGRVRLRRVYDFQYSDTGHNRRNGTITLLRGEVLALDLGADLAQRPTLH